MERTAECLQQMQATYVVWICFDLYQSNLLYYYIQEVLKCHKIYIQESFFFKCLNQKVTLPYFVRMMPLLRLLQVYVKLSVL